MASTLNSGAQMTKARTLAQQILDAQAEVAAWPPGLRESVQLQGPVDHWQERQIELIRMDNEREAKRADQLSLDDTLPPLTSKVLH